MYNVYEGRTVRIRPFVSADEYAAMALEQGIELNPHWGSWFEPRADTLKSWEGTGGIGTGGYNNMAIERLDTGELIGYEEYGLDLPQLPAAWVGTYIMPAHHGQRFGVEAKQLMYCCVFENFAVQRIYTDTVETHLAAARGLKLSGMRYEGRKTKRTIKDGRFIDSVHYALYREEWEAMPYRHKVGRKAYWYGAAQPALSSAA